MKQIIFCLLIVLLFSCKKENDRDQYAAGLRIVNQSSFLLDSVLVQSPGGRQTYIAIKPGEVSVYKQFTFLYRYAYVEIFFNSKSLKLIPIDYVGEQKIEGGNYSCNITIPAANPIFFRATFVRD
jgi:hypothetical protein